MEEVKVMAKKRKKCSGREPAYSLLYRPEELPLVKSISDIDNILDLVSKYLKNNFNRQQEKSFLQTFSQRISLLWGPPGTGKTTVLAGVALGWIEYALKTGTPVCIGVGASNYNAIDNVLREINDLMDLRNKNIDESLDDIRIVRIRSEASDPPSDCRFEDIVRKRTSEELQELVQELSLLKQSIIIGGTFTQLGRMAEMVTGDDKVPVAPWLDLLIIDEASQVPVTTAGGYFLLLKSDAHVILAGDDKQLGPVYQFKLREDEAGLLDCIYTYMKKTHEIEPVLLEQNYRTNVQIADWPKQRFYEERYEAYFPDKKLGIKIPDNFDTSNWPSKLPWSEDFLQILDPEIPIAIITYPPRPYTLSNPFEAQLVSSLTYLYWYILNLEKSIDIRDFWLEKLGIVTPHRAQKSLIKNLIMDTVIPREFLPVVDTVDRFQGQERDLIIASYGVGDPEFIAQEEEFILCPRRFNVTLTRARSKFILFINEALLFHLPNDKDIAAQSVHLQLFSEEYCSVVNQDITLPYFETGNIVENMPCKLRGLT